MVAIVSDTMVEGWLREYLLCVVDSGRPPHRWFFDLTYGVASLCLMQFMGNDWWWRQMSPLARGRSREFLRYPSLDDIDGARNSERVEALATGLLNLQEVEGFQHLLDRLATNDLEATIAEVRVPDMLQASGRAFRFNPPRGQRGADYDIDLTLPGGITVAAEIKCKLEGSRCSTDTLVSAFRKITDQCPRNRPCVGFVCLPEQWRVSGGFSSDLLKALQSVFRNSSRLWSAVVSWEHYQIIDDRYCGCFRQMLEFRNPRIPNAPPMTECILHGPHEGIYNSQWRSWQARIKGCLRDLNALDRVQLP